jgi:4-amino-4-deoxy-L-arabinose transferase-like glycosyltransferase
MAYFSFTTGLFHRYYLIMMGPPLAALAGITAWTLIQLWKRRPLWAWTVLLVLSGFTVAFEIFTLRHYVDTFGVVTPIAIISWMAGMVLLLRRGTPGTPWVGIALLSTGLLATPLAWSALTTFNTHPDVALPTAGADRMSATTFMTPNQESLGPVGEAILAHVQASTHPSSYLLATSTARDAAPFILATGSPVFTFGGFTGNDPIVDLDGFIGMLEQGELRYVLGLPQQKPEIARWIRGHCAMVEVPGPERHPLFDCRLGD